MSLDSLFSRQLTLFQPSGIATKKQCLTSLSRFYEHWNPDLKHQHVFDALHARERMGHTAITEHVAIPHARIPNLERPIGILMSLAQPIAFDPDGGHPVSLIFSLLVPTDADQKHLDILKQLAQLLSNPQNTQSLLLAHDAEELWQQFFQLTALPAV